MMRKYRGNGSLELWHAVRDGASVVLAYDEDTVLGHRWLSSASLRGLVLPMDDAVEVATRRRCWMRAGVAGGVLMDSVELEPAEAQRLLEGASPLAVLTGQDEPGMLRARALTLEELMSR